MKKFAYRAVPVVFFGWLLVAFLVSGLTRAQAPAAKDEQQNPTPCIDCIKIRVGIPQVIRGPAPDIENFTEIQLPGGRFRGFVASAKTYAIDGNRPWDMGGPARVVLDLGASDFALAACAAVAKVSRSRRVAEILII
jgi:hypothetical protein